LSELQAESDALITLHARGGVFIFEIMFYPVSIFFKVDSIHKPPAQPVRIEKVLPLPGEHTKLNLNEAGGF
jgi:hypothetical protein